MSHRRPVAERSESGGLILRFDDVLLVRGNRGTWLLDVQTQVDGGQRRLQIPIGRHKVFDSLAAELLRADVAQGHDVHEASRE
jgi:hypothetical protein